MVKLNFWRHLNVLMWKHAMIRKRRLLHVVLELVLPLTLFIFLFYGRNKLNEIIDWNDKRKPEVNATALGSNTTMHRVLYTPYTAETKALMADIGKILNLTEVRVSNIDHDIVGYWTASKEYMKEFSRQMKNDEAIIIFHMDDEYLRRQPWRSSLELRANEQRDVNSIIRGAYRNITASRGQPKQFNYTIRMKKEFLTGTVTNSVHKSQYDVRFPNEGRIYNNFVKLQWAVDQAYLSNLTGAPVRLKLSLRKFPRFKVTCTDMSKITKCVLIRLATKVSLLVPFVFIVSRLLEERMNGVQELMKMVGVTSSTLGVSHFLNCLPSVLVYGLFSAVLMTVTSTPLLTYTSPVLIFIALTLYYITILAFAFATSYIPKSLNYSIMITIMVFVMVVSLQFYLSIQKNLSSPGLLLTGVIPHNPIDWFWSEVTYKEMLCQGLGFNDIFTKYEKAATGTCIMMMILQIFVLFLITWYLDKIRPGPYSIARPWNFLCQKQFWSKVEPQEILPEDADEEQYDPQYFEEPHQDLQPGVQVTNITKVFGPWKGPKTIALSNLSLTMYKGEITVLLGHNGAGKTTLMSIITGMLNATRGKVFINGVETSRDLDRVRRDLGLCPQENLSFPDLTILQHIVFFAMLKGMSYKQAKNAGLELVAKLKLQGKEHFRSNELSGGMKRRLQLACALAGDASVIILDEPTSGLDVETRRELWDLLLGLRGTRTVLLTTHFMEEADALGDRVAAIHAGRLKCYATPMFLKRAVGTGYRLSLTVKKSADVEEITKSIEKHIPEVTLSDQTSSTLVYRLPIKSSKDFSKLFNELEVNREVLGIETIGVGLTTLDEVFFKLCSDVALIDIDEYSSTQIEETVSPKIKGVSLYMRIVRILLKRQVKATLYIWKTFLLFQIILPIAILFLFTHMCNDDEKPNNNHNPSSVMNLDLYKDTGHNNVFLNLRNTSNILRSVNNEFPKINFVQSFNIDKDVMRTKDTNITEYKKYLAGIDTSANKTTLYVSTALRHTVPAVVNLYSNILATSLLPRTNQLKLINMYNHPIQDVLRTKGDVFIAPKISHNAMFWSALIVLVILSNVINEIYLPCRERIQGTRHFHIMSGCPPLLYWVVTCVYDLLLPVLLILPGLVIACVVLEKDHTFDRVDFLVALYIFLLIGITAFLWFIYVVSFIFKEGGASLVVSTFVIFFGFLVSFPIFEIQVENQMETIASTTLSILGLFTPPLQISMGVMKITKTARLNAYCHLNRLQCPDIQYIKDFDSKFCCESSSNWGPYNYFNRDSCGIQLIVLIAHIIIYSILIIMIEQGIVSNILNKLLNLTYKPSPKEYSDELAIEETQYVNEHIDVSPPEAAVMVHNLHKKYFNICGKTVVAVRGINFHVKKGECFGLLGVNGAGKSTSFKMITGETAMTRGNIYANGYYLKKQRSKFLYSLGYCPQYGGVDLFLTGAENLELLLTIRGVPTEDIKDEVLTWIKCVGLERYANRPVSGYSGGCNRRLAAAVALASSAAVCVLDEPTAGVDVTARRRVWAALRRGLARHSAVVVTSHSMDEMEMLSNRIAIMCSGEICAMGTPAALRAHHASGYALRIKLKMRYYKGSLPGAPGREVREEVESNYQAVLRDQHQTMLHYHILDKVPYSQLFSFMERLKENYRDMVEDYSVTETTLEEVFLSFAKKSTNS